MVYRCRVAERAERCGMSTGRRHDLSVAVQTSNSLFQLSRQQIITHSTPYSRSRYIFPVAVTPKMLYILGYDEQ